MLDFGFVCLCRAEYLCADGATPPLGICGWRHVLRLTNLVDGWTSSKNPSKLSPGSHPNHSLLRFRAMPSIPTSASRTQEAGSPWQGLVAFTVPSGGLSPEKPLRIGSSPGSTGVKAGVFLQCLTTLGMKGI